MGSAWRISHFSLGIVLYVEAPCTFSFAVRNRVSARGWLKSLWTQGHSECGLVLQSQLLVCCEQERAHLWWGWSKNGCLKGTCSHFWSAYHLLPPFWTCQRLEGAGSAQSSTKLSASLQEGCGENSLLTGGSKGPACKVCWSHQVGAGVFQVAVLLWTACWWQLIHFLASHLSRRLPKQKDCVHFNIL